MADPRDDRVELTDLDVIARYSLAVRTAAAARDELIDTLRADLAWLEGGRRARPAPTTASRAAAKPATGTVTRAAAKNTAKKTAKKAAGKTGSALRRGR